MRKIVANLYLLKEGGREKPIPMVNYGCPVFFNSNSQLKDHAYDCRILVKEYGQPLELGKEIKGVSIVFLSPNDVFPYVNIGDKFELWERGVVGCGEIIDIKK